MRGVAWWVRGGPGDEAPVPGPDGATLRGGALASFECMSIARALRQRLGSRTGVPQNVTHYVGIERCSHLDSENLNLNILSSRIFAGCGRVSFCFLSNCHSLRSLERRSFWIIFGCLGTLPPNGTIISARGLYLLKVEKMNCFASSVRSTGSALLERNVFAWNESIKGGTLPSEVRVRDWLNKCNGKEYPTFKKFKRCIIEQLKYFAGNIPEDPHIEPYVAVAAPIDISYSSFSDFDF